MSKLERRTEDPQADSEAQAVEWVSEGGGVTLQLIVDESLANGLNPEAREKLQIAVERVAAVFVRILNERQALENAGTSMERAFNLLAEHMRDVSSLYGVLSGTLGPTSDPDFPF
ncbi:MAG: hypothetical protein MN733_10665 [Nitrososphaera sp.]|nr:hypothetical protein [Nitrososphaera sp.]